MIMLISKTILLDLLDTYLIYQELWSFGIGHWDWYPDDVRCEDIYMDAKDWFDELIAR